MGNKPESKLFRALWYAWQLPELNRHQATLEKDDNPLVDLAYQTIQGGKTALAEAVRAGDPVLLNFLDQVYGYAPGQKLQTLLLEKAKNHAEGIWPDRDPVMVAPAIADTFGEFADMADHVCRTWFETYGNSRRVKGTALTRTGHHWRKGKRREGRPVMYCVGCYEKRVRRVVNQVVNEAHTGLHISHLTQNAARKAIQRLRQQDKRNASANQYQHANNDNVMDSSDNRGKVDIINLATKPTGATTYKLLLQRNGQAVLIHNRPQAIGGESIPTTRIELFSLLFEYCQTPEGRRVDGSAGFGGVYNGSMGDGRKKHSDTDREDDLRQIVIQAKDHAAHQRIMLEAGLMTKTKQYGGKQAYHPNVTWPMYIETLETGGIKYTVIEGADLLAEILTKSEKKRTDLATGKTPEETPVAKSVHKEAKEPRQLEFEAMFGRPTQ